MLFRIYSINTKKKHLYFYKCFVVTRTRIELVLPP